LEGKVRFLVRVTSAPPVSLFHTPLFSVPWEVMNP